MDDFTAFLLDTLKQFFLSFWEAIKGFGLGVYGAVNYSEYSKILLEYKDQFTTVQWVLAILVYVVLVAVLVGIVILIITPIRISIRKNANNASKDALLQEVQKLNADVIRLTKEKDKILQIKVGNYAQGMGADVSGEGDEQVATNGRFSKLAEVDAKYKDYDAEAEPFDHNITLPEICERFRNFACSRMGLFYEIRIIRLFVAALSSTRVIILQGISGTGKTSLPYAWGKFLDNETMIASVQPSWRDRTEIFGYFNEFTKRFNETEVIKRMYEARYTNKVYFTVLDEMNIARVEYYFAEMLSILEMPSKDEWIVDIVPSGWKDDPKKIEGGRFKLPDNMWYVGTANNDDSTFAISDKVYDRAIPINIDSKGIKFDAPLTDKLCLDYRDLDRQFAEAKEKFKVGEELLNKVEQLDNYVIEHFRIAFGNRIVKQLKEFVPAFVGCGGAEIDGLDYVLTNKIFRKFEALNLSFIRDEIDGLCDYLSVLFGDENMQESKAYLMRLKRLV